VLRKSLCLFSLLFVASVLLPRHARAQTYTVSTVYSFCNTTTVVDGYTVCTDGMGGVDIVQGGDGNFYGTTAAWWPPVFGSASLLRNFF
jgi:hypothetical protein